MPYTAAAAAAAAAAAIAAAAAAAGGQSLYSLFIATSSYINNPQCIRMSQQSGSILTHISAEFSHKNYIVLYMDNKHGLILFNGFYSTHFIQSISTF